MCQSQYRNSFTGLRLVLELYLQGIFLSVDLLGLDEWLSSEKDTIWASIIDSSSGVFSKKFCRAFFPDLETFSGNFETMARTLYRELSECTHGNMPRSIVIPTSLSFNQDAFDMWMSKCATLRLVLHYSLTLRYLKELSTDQRFLMEGALVDQLGRIPAIRSYLGGVV